jgi:hypothetical protein
MRTASVAGTDCAIRKTTVQPEPQGADPKGYLD